MKKSIIPLFIVFLLALPLCFAEDVYIKGLR